MIKRTPSKLIYSIFGVIFMLMIGNTSSLSQEISLKPAYSIHSVAWHPNGELLAVGTSESIKILDQNLQVLQELHSFSDAVTAVAWNSDGTKLAAGSRYEDGRIVVWEFDSATHDFTLHKILDRPYASDYQVLMLKWNPDDGQLGVLGLHSYMVNTYVVFVYDTTVWTHSKREIERIDRVLAKFVWNPDGTKIAVTGRPDQAYIYIIDTLTMLQEAIWFSYIETDVLEWTRDNYLIIEDPYNDHYGVNLMAPPDPRSLVTITSDNANFGISFLNNAKNALVFFSADGLEIWDIYTSRQLYIYDAQYYPVSMDWSVNDKIALASIEDLLAEDRIYTLEIIDVSNLRTVEGVPTSTPFPTWTPYPTLAPTSTFTP